MSESAAFQPLCHKPCWAKLFLTLLVSACIVGSPQGLQAQEHGGALDGAALAGSGSSANVLPGSSAVGPNGTFQYGVPMSVAPGRAGIAPSVGLSYNSGGASDSSLAGYGWDMPMDVITRSTRCGVDLIYSNHEFFASSGELVLVDDSSADHEFRPRFEGSFIRYFYNTNTTAWTAYDQSGTKFTYGSSTNTQMYDSNDVSRIFGWYLEEVRDIHGNYMTYSYFQDQGSVYPKEITYTGHDTTDGLMSVRFEPFYSGPTTNDIRPDVTSGFGTGFKSTRQYRLQEVSSYADTDLAYKYALVYTTGVNGARSILESVISYGSDGTSSLPAAVFSYSAPDADAEPEELPAYLLPEDMLTLGNLNSDTNFMPDDGAVRFTDVNGDGLIDVLYANPISGGFVNGAEQGKRAWLNTGEGWVESVQWRLPQFMTNGRDHLYFIDFLDGDKSVDPAGVNLVDVNGDGASDILFAQTYKDGSTIVDNRACWLSSTNGWVRDDRWCLPTNYTFTSTYKDAGITGAIIDMGVQFPDLNGDGLVDMVYAATNYPGGTFTDGQIEIGKQTWLNTGSGWQENDTWEIPTNHYLTASLSYDNFGAWSGKPDSGAIQFVDVNGDGLSDFVYANGHADKYHAGPEGETKETWINTGSGFEKDDAWTLPVYETNGSDRVFFIDNLSFQGNPDYPEEDTGLRFLDVNSDGLPDVVLSRSYWRNTPKPEVVLPLNKVWLNTGSGWEANDLFAPPDDCVFAFSFDPAEDWYVVDSGTRPVDLNGDGVIDYLYARDHYGSYMSNGQVPQGRKTWSGISGRELLDEIQNGLGGSVQIHYKPAAWYEDHDSPITYQVVDRLVSFDGLGASYTSRYDYAGGWFFFDTNECQRSEFRGFHRVSTIDSTGAKNVTYYHQGGGMNGSDQGEHEDHEAKAGMPYRTELYGSNGVLYASSVAKVELDTYTDAVDTNEVRYFTRVAEGVSFTFEGTEQHRETASRNYIDPATGLSTNSVNLGEVSADPDTGEILNILAGDELYTFTEYAGFTNTYIIGRPSRVLVTSDSAGSNRLTEAKMTYKSSSLPESGLAWLDTTDSFITNSFVISYDIYGNPTSLRDAIGIVTSNVFDSTHHTFPVSQTVGGFNSSSVFDSRNGALLSSINPIGVTVSNQYDVFYRPVKSWVDGIWTREMDYTVDGISNGIPGNVIHSMANTGTNIAGNADSYSYADGMGRVIQTRVESERGNYRVSNAVFDEHGRVTEAYEPYFESGESYQAYSPNNPAMRTEYDALGRAVKNIPRRGETDSPTAPSSVAFTDGSNLWTTVTTDALGQVRKQSKDAYGRTISITEYLDSSPVTMTYHYDLLGRLTNVVDAENNTIEMDYDSMGRKIRMDDPDMGVWVYEHDVVGRMTNQVDSKGQRVVFDYSDHLGRLKTKKIYDSASNLVDTVTFHYDSSPDAGFNVYTGQLYMVTESAGTNRFSYNTHGNVLKSELQVTGHGTFVVTNVYDELDRPISSTYPNGVAEVQNHYGPIGNLESISSLAGVGESNVTFYTVDTINELGQIEQVSYGNGVETRYAHYASSRRLRQSLTRKKNGQSYQSLGYSYNAGGLITDIEDHLRSGENAATYENIVYDDFYRLTSLDRYDASTNGMKTFTFAYDVLGNITRNDDYDPAESYVYSNARPHAVSSIGTNEFFYDACGNITNYLDKTLVYDARNRLIQVVTDDGITVNYSYMDSGARLTKQVIANGETNTTLYIGKGYEEKDGDQLCHVFFGGKRVASFTPIEEGGQASLFQRFNEYIGFSTAAAQWTQMGKPDHKTQTLHRYVAFLSANPQPVAYALYVLPLLLFCLILLKVGISRGEFAPRAPPLQRVMAYVLTLAFFYGSIPSVSYAQGAFPRGDVNGDGNIDMADAMLILQVVHGKRSPTAGVFTAAGFGNGDVNYDGATNATDARLIADYVVGNGSLPTPPSETQKFVYYHDDHLGSGNIITDKEGELIQHIEYTPYGETRHELNLGVSINYLYTGQEYDREIGIYYYNARYYDANLGRFLQSDSIVPAAGDHQAYNRYSYVRNNPIMMNDPTGHAGNAVSRFQNYQSSGSNPSPPPDTAAIGEWYQGLPGWQRRQLRTSGDQRAAYYAQRIQRDFGVNVSWKGLGTNSTNRGARGLALYTYMSTGQITGWLAESMEQDGYDDVGAYFGSVANRVSGAKGDRAVGFAILASIATGYVLAPLGGAIAGALGGGFWGGLAGAVAVGAASGALVGGSSAAAAGGSFSDGAKAGAISGGISSGATYIFYAAVNAFASIYSNRLGFWSSNESAATFSRAGYEDFSARAGTLSDVVDVNGLDNYVEILDAAKNLNGVPYDSVHFLGHGSPGAQFLGGKYLSAQSADFWKGVGALIKENGTIYLEGCNVACGSVGQNYIQTIATSSGRKVVSSSFYQYHLRGTGANFTILGTFRSASP